MWFNDSFTAITEHISNLRQSIPTIQTSGDNPNQQRELTTKIGLLKNEVIRHRNIASMYKERWLQAERVCQETTGKCSQIYDDINLTDEDEDLEVDKEPNLLIDNTESNVIQQESDEVCSLQQLDDNIAIQQSQTEPIQENEPSTIKNTKSPKCLNFNLDSATIQIHRLEDEIKKLKADGEHWRKLAKQKSTIEEAQLVDLNQVRSQLKDCTDDCHRYEQRCQHLEQLVEQMKHESGYELQQLDALHEEEKNKLLTLRNELIEQNSQLKLELEEWKNKMKAFETHNRQDMVTQTESIERSHFESQAKEDLGNLQKFPRNIQEIIEELVEHLPQLDDNKFNVLKSLEKIVYERNNFLQPEEQKTTSMTLLDNEQNSIPTTTTTLNHGEHDVNHLMDELDKISKEKCQLEQKLDELQLRLSQQEQESHIQSIDNKNNNDECNSTSISYSEELTEDENTDQNQNQNYRLLQKDNCVEDLRMKLISLTREHEELCQKLNSSHNENQIFERRFKETEEESVKLSHKIHQMEQERDSLQTQLTEIETKKNVLQEELDSSKKEIILQAELKQKVDVELEHWRNQCQSLKNQLIQSNDNYILLKSSLVSKDEELIQVREDLTKLELNKMENNEQVEKLTIELDRLKQHLVQVEETYLGYLKESEERYEQSQQIIVQYEQMNLEQKQKEHEELVRSLKKELDQAQEKLHQFEDKSERLAANLINLQSVIEQLEKEHQRKILSLNEEHEKQLLDSENRIEKWRKRLNVCEEHLNETLKALEAASRLSEKIDQKEFVIEQLKREVKDKDEELLKLKKRFDHLEASSEGKVDKQIIKSLIISYLATPTDKRSDGEKLLARFLDFNQEEMNRVGIRVGRDAKSNSDSFTSKFVQFLETESIPDTNSLNNVNSGQERKPFISLMNNLQQVELARDLNKRLNKYDQNGTQRRMNPFIGQPMTPSTINYHNNNLSLDSQSFDNSQNQLLANVDYPMLNIPSTIVLPVTAIESSTIDSNMPEIVKDAICKDKSI